MRLPVPLVRLALRLSPLLLAAPTFAAPAADVAHCPTTGAPIHEARFVPINGIEQWVTIDGDDCRNPVVQMVHGGPGNPLTPFAERIYGPWRGKFTLVQWDQRGAGKTFGRNPLSDDTPLTLQQLADDGVALSAWLQTHLQQKKVILFGSSWGSAVAVQMAQTRPELYSAYVGSAQLVSGTADMAAGYQKLLNIADDADSRARLKQIGAPPWTDPHSFGIFRRVTRIYENKVTAAAPLDWWKRAAEYDSKQARADEAAGEDYSYLQFVGRHGDGMQAGLDLRQSAHTFAMPVFLIQGQDDLVTPPEVSKAWFDSITAPQKLWVLLVRTGHDPNRTMVEAQYKVLTDNVLPLTR